MKRELEFHADHLPGHVNPDDEAEGLPINYLQLAIRYKWRLLCGLIVGLVIGHLVYVQAGPEYEAVSSILVSRKYAPPVREEDRHLTVTSKPSEHIPLILSPMIAERAVEIGELQKLPTFRGETDIAQCVLDGLKVKRTSGTDRTLSNVLEIRYASPQPADARKVAQAVIDAYDQYLKESSKEQSSEVSRLAKKTTADMVAKLHAKEQEYRDFLLTVPEDFRSALGPKTQSGQVTNIAPEDVIRTLGEERNRNRVRQAELASRQRSLEKAIAAGDAREAIELQVRRYLNLDGRAGEDPDRATQINIYQSQLLPLLIKERDLSRQFGRDYPELVAVRKSIETILETYAKLGLRFPEGAEAAVFARARGAQMDFVSLYQDSLKHQIDELALKDRELGDHINREGLRAKEFAHFQSIDTNLRAEVVLHQDLWRQQLDRENEVAIEKDTNGYTMRTLAPVKDELVLKRMMKFYGGGAAFGLFLVAVICVVRELKDLTLKNVRDVRVTLRQPVLGSVVTFDVLVDRAAPKAGVPHPALRYLHAPNSIEAENYRSIRTALLVSAENRDLRTILVSSPEPGDGKTTLVSNLAIALAQSGKRVLLIDGDLRRPTVHQLFRVRQDIGLTEVLLGEIDFLNAVQPTNIDRLSLLTAGASPANPAEILSSPKLHSVLDEARGEFDFVLVDAPPLLAVSDPCILARHVDGMLVVTRLGKNTRAAAVRVRELIEDQRIPVLGTVANGAAIGHHRGYNYYGEYISGGPPGTSPRREESRELVGA